MNTIIVSDLHIGSKYSRCTEIMDFIGKLPLDCAIVLNGDVMDYFHWNLTKQQIDTLDLLRKESLKRQIVWIRGNHDKRYVFKNPEKIEFKTSHSIGKRLFITHGHDFEKRPLFSYVFVAFFYIFYRLRNLFSKEPMHVAFYAKRYTRLYKTFRDRVSVNALKYALNNGYEAVICGHTHYVEECVNNGIRYMNTGSWTEEPFYYVSVNDKNISLKIVGN